MDTTSPGKDEKESAPTREEVIRNYEYFSFAALVMVVLIMVQRGSGLLAVMPFLVGLGGIVGAWRAGVPLFLLAATFAIACINAPLFRRMFTSAWDHDPVSDFLLGAAVLGYAAGQCRLQGASRSVLPPDPRQKRGKMPADLKAPGRQGEFGREMLVLAMAVTLWAALAPVFWEKLPVLGRGAMPEPVWRVLAPLVESGRYDAVSDVWARVWRLGVLAWVLIVGTFVCRALLRLLSKAVPEEALMYIQDIFWRETRGEQRRLFRWLAWARLRRERRRRPVPLTPVTGPWEGPAPGKK
jgi:hypothetical protein